MGRHPTSHPSYTSRMIRLKRITVMMVMMLIVLPCCCCCLFLMPLLYILYRQKSTPLIRNSRIFSKIIPCQNKIKYCRKSLVSKELRRPARRPVVVSRFIVTVYVNFFFLVFLLPPPYTPHRGPDYLIHPSYHTPLYSHIEGRVR